MKSLSDNPLVSVVIPCYNAAATLTDAVKSALSQTYDNIEIFVVDDGSTDNSCDVAASFGDSITYIHKENGGPASARNIGINHSQGELIAFLDADDLWLPEKLANQVAFLRTHPDTALLCTAVWRHADEYREIKSCVMLPDSQISYLRLWEDNPITTSTVICPREVFTAIGGFDEDTNIHRAEDFDLWLRIAASFHVRFLDEPLATYNVSNSGLNRSDLEKSFSALLYAYGKQSSTALAQGVTATAIEKKKYKLYRLCGERLFGVNSFGPARKYLLLAFRHYATDPALHLYLLATFFSEKHINLLRRMVSWRPRPRSN